MDQVREEQIQRLIRYGCCTREQAITLIEQGESKKREQEKESNGKTETTG